MNATYGLQDSTSSSNVGLQSSSESRLRPTSSSAVAMRSCKKCCEIKPASEFRRWSHSPDGYRNACKKCQCAEELAKRQTSGNGARYAKEFRERNPTAYAITRCRQTALKKGLDFDLHLHFEELDRRVRAGVCELTGYPLDLAGPSTPQQRRPNAASIDRIDSKKGYVLSNVRVVCLAVNLALGTWGENGLLPILKAWNERL
jgi:hypothetical protein